MEILYRGTKPSDIEYEGTCGVCNTRAKFKREEATEVDGDRNGSGFLWVKCPVCTSRIISKFKRYIAPSPYGGARD